MAERVLATPEEVQQYTVFPEVKNRPLELLAFDIVQATADIYAWVGHKFSEAEYPEIPPVVNLTAIKLAEYYALLNSDDSAVKGYQSESIGNYSYSLGNGSTKTVSLGTLLKDYVKKGGNSSSGFRMWSL